MSKLKIAVIGSGISGLSCSHYLSKFYEVDIYEKNNYFGGHANTHTFEDANGEINVDTGFIVFNRLNYPNLCDFFDDLNVKSYDSDMSFSVSMGNGKLEYSGSSLLSIFSQKKNLVNIKFLKMLYEIIRFYNEAENDIHRFRKITIDEYLSLKKYSKYFKQNHLYPMAASIWSSPVYQISKYPFSEFVTFFSNHGLLRIFNRPKWQTVCGGSKEYVKKVLMNPGIRAIKNSNVKIKFKEKGNWEIKCGNKTKTYDHLVVSIHSDQIKDVMKDYKKSNLRIFSSIKYTKNLVYLHSDQRLMPKNKKVWASWNYIENKLQISVTYWMNQLQNLKTNNNYFVSLNPAIHPDKKKTIRKLVYDHPVFDNKAFDSQKKIESLQGKNNLWFCGAYLGYGFHEDGIKSGIKVAKKIFAENKI